VRNLHRALGATLTVVVTGCYTFHPVATGTAPLDKRVAFDVTDAGRIALGGSMGPAIRRIEGRLVRRDGEDYVVAVSSVAFLSGGTDTWTGEPVRLKPEYVGMTYERRLSKSRTIAASAVGVGAVAFILTRSLVGGGSGAERLPPRDSLGTTSRGPRP
jgi:hypothetical protein